jgi:hypothetical protein
MPWLCDGPELGCCDGNIGEPCTPPCWCSPWPVGDDMLPPAVDWYPACALPCGGCEEYCAKSIILAVLSIVNGERWSRSSAKVDVDGDGDGNDADIGDCASNVGGIRDSIWNLLLDGVCLSIKSTRPIRGKGTSRCSRPGYKTRMGCRLTLIAWSPGLGMVERAPLVQVVRLVRCLVRAA